MSSTSETPHETFGRRAILAAVFGNVVALRAVLDDCRREGVDDIVCLGNICGWGPDPVESIDLIREHCRWALCGHFDAALFLRDPINFNLAAKSRILWQRTQLKPRWYSSSKTRDRWRWLSELPSSHKEGVTQYVVGSTRDPLFEYVFEEDFADIGFGVSCKAKETIERIEKVCFSGGGGFGRPGVVTDRYKWLVPRKLTDMRFRISTKPKFFISVGSVGSPRDRNPDACYVIYDKIKQIVQFRRVKYDIKAAQQRYMKVPYLDERYWKRLEVGI